MQTIKWPPADVDAFLASKVPLVRSIAQKMAKSLSYTVQSDELLAAGTIGLIKAVQTFEPARGILFETYATFRVRGEILDTIREDDQTPRLMRQRVKQLEQYKIAAETKFGRHVNLEEIAVHNGVTVEELTHLGIHTANAFPCSVNVDYASDGTRDYHGADNIQDLSDAGEAQHHLDVLRLTCRGLSKVERILVILYYYCDLTMKEIGTHLGMSESRVSQLHARLMLRKAEYLRGQESEFTQERRRVHNPTHGRFTSNT